jgi:hypothetical protein
MATRKQSHPLARPAVEKFSILHPEIETVGRVWLASQKEQQ